MYNYRVSRPDAWSGRVDSTDNRQAFRLHQVVEIINLEQAEELEAHQDKMTAVNFAFIGFESDLGVRLNQGRPGAHEAPDMIRQKLASLPFKLEDTSMIDVGNVYATDDLDRAQQALGEITKDLMNRGYLPIILGGGHETALADYYGHWLNEEKHLGIVNIDAHFDNRPYQESGASSGTMFRQIYDITQSKDYPYTYFVLGIQDHGNTQELFNYADETGVEYYSTQEVISDQSGQISSALDSWLDKVDKVMLTVDMDVFNVAIAPGVSATQPFGLFPDHIQSYLDQVIQSGKVASLDVVEVSPANDQNNNQTAQLAATLIYYMMQSWQKAESAKK